MHDAVGLKTARIIRLYGLCRPKNAITPLLALMLGAVLANQEALRHVNLSVAALSLILLNFFWTLQNDIEDIEIDRAAKRNTPLVNGEFTTSQIRTFAYSILGIAIMLPVLYSQKAILIFVVFYLFMCWAYNSKPLQLSRKPISSILVLTMILTFAPLVFGYYLFANSLSPTLVALACGGLLYRFSTSLLKDFKDYKADKKFHKQTFLIKFGANIVRSISLLFAILGYSMMFAVTLILINSLLSFVVACLICAIGLVTIYYRYALSTRISDFQKNNLIFHKILNLQLVIEVGLIACFYIL